MPTYFYCRCLVNKNTALLVQCLQSWCAALMSVIPLCFYHHTIQGHSKYVLALNAELNPNRKSQLTEFLCKGT